VMRRRGQAPPPAAWRKARCGPGPARGSSGGLMSRPGGKFQRPPYDAPRPSRASPRGSAAEAGTPETVRVCPRGQNAAVASIQSRTGPQRGPNRAPSVMPGSNVIPAPLLGYESPEMSSSVAATPTRASAQVADQFLRDPTVASNPYRRQVPSPGPTDRVCAPTKSAPTAGMMSPSGREKATSIVATGAGEAPFSDAPRLAPGSTSIG